MNTDNIEHCINYANTEIFRVVAANRELLELRRLAEIGRQHEASEEQINRIKTERWAKVVQNE